MSDPTLHPCFLGPYAENDAMLERLVVEFMREHVYWRRNVHPEDPPAIPTGAAQRADFQALEARMRRELHTLSAAMKRSVPFHSPRYIGHMVSDLLLPAVAAHMLTLPYNPNNVSEDAAPVTVEMEVRVGLQLARLFGFCTDVTRPDCAVGHLTSGGTVANYQALRLALALKAFPVALRAVAPGELASSLATYPADDREAFGLHTHDATALYAAWCTWLASLPRNERRRFAAALERERIETLGLATFHARHPTLQPPLVLAPATAHYSWSKGMKLLGLGREQLLRVDETDMRLDPDALEQALAAARRRGQPVLLAVAVFGTTEFGTIDPVDAVVAARERHANDGFGFGVHVDAAWGGYLATLFREADGRLRTHADVGADFESFPSPATHAAVAALAQVDSITVDPHKLGYVPYGAGAFVCRDQRRFGLLAEQADYVFDGDDAADYFGRYRRLGRYVIEGSKPGTAAAAVYVTHRVLPLDHREFGRIPRQSLRAAEAFRAAAARFSEAVAPDLRVCVPIPPDSNLVCLALNLAGNRSVPDASAFVRRLHKRMNSSAAQALQRNEFFGSVTTLRLSLLRPDAAARLLDTLGLAAPGDPADDGLVVLRHTIMNPYFLDDENGISYAERYFEFLGREVAALGGGNVDQAA